jgi:hypothetical protein
VEYFQGPQYASRDPSGDHTGRQPRATLWRLEPSPFITSTLLNGQSPPESNTICPLGTPAARPEPVTVNVMSRQQAQTTSAVNRHRIAPGLYDAVLREESTERKDLQLERATEAPPPAIAMCRPTTIESAKPERE